MFRPLEEALADLEPFDVDFYRIPRLAWDHYNDKQRTERGFLSRLRIQADMLHGYMEWYARQLLTGRPGIALSSPEEQGFHFDILDKWRFRLHKLNDDFTIQNNRTALALQFIEQDAEQMAFFGEPTNLHLGYRLNSAKSGLASVHVVCPRSEEDVSWHYTVLPQEPKDDARIVPIRPDTGPPSPRLRPIEQPAQAPQRDRESGA